MGSRLIGILTFIAEFRIPYVNSRIGHLAQVPERLARVWTEPEHAIIASLSKLGGL